jgi:CheY-like chemotaxis protein
MMRERIEEGDESEESAVLVVDDDQDVRVALSSLFRSAGLAAESFASAEELLAHGIPDRPTCIVLDVHLHGERPRPAGHAQPGGPPCVDRIHLRPW